MAQAEINKLQAATAWDSKGKKLGDVNDVHLEKESGIPAWVTVSLGLLGGVVVGAVSGFAIGLLVDRHGIAQAEGFLHVFEGWVIFISCIALLFLLAIAMRRLSGERGRLGEAVVTENPHREAVGDATDAVVQLAQRVFVAPRDAVEQLSQALELDRDVGG
jgi:hypothetical protein